MWELIAIITQEDRAFQLICGKIWRQSIPCFTRPAKKLARAEKSDVRGN
jgi:hypothetical protein